MTLDGNFGVLSIERILPLILLKAILETQRSTVQQRHCPISYQNQSGADDHFRGLTVRYKVFRPKKCWFPVTVRKYEVGR